MIDNEEYANSVYKKEKKIKYHDKYSTIFF
jgi:hypothetical protein